MPGAAGIDHIGHCASAGILTRLPRGPATVALAVVPLFSNPARTLNYTNTLQPGGRQALAIAPRITPQLLSVEPRIGWSMASVL